MSDISMEEKLHLVQQLRAQTYENNHALHSRGKYIYGKSGFAAPQRESSQTEKNLYLSEQEKEPSSFQLRFFMAVLLFAAFVLMDMNDIKVAGITMEKIEQVISADYEDKLELWVETMAR